MEDDMENAALLGQLMGGLGLLLTGVGVLWFVSVYQEKKKILVGGYIGEKPGYGLRNHLQGQKPTQCFCRSNKK